MKHKRWRMLYIVCCFLVCLIPFIFMPWFASREPLGNEKKVSLPAVLEEEGSVNVHYLSGLGDYFEHHYAFRPWLITADARIQAGIFQVSNTDSVITGQNGWLYYRSTLDDFLGERTLSERGRYNLAHNLALIQNYVLSHGAKFLFLTPPNKNSLYPQFMPYYFQAPEGAEHNRDYLPDLMKEEQIFWINTKQLFEEQETILYRKKDSHWGQQGAVLVTEAIFDALEKEHLDYRALNTKIAPSQASDLADMIYPASGEREEETIYDLPVRYAYIPNPASSDPISVEDFRIETANPEGSENLLMYRDSFGNTLLPLLANEFAHGYFSKGIPYSIARDMTLYEPDVVIVELVERNLRNLAQNPAIFPAPEVSLLKEQLTEAAGAEVTVSACMADTSYLTFQGVLPDDARNFAPVYLEIAENGKSVIYEAFTISDGETDFAYIAYLPAARFESIEQAQQAVKNVYIGQ